jgi:four helix bundle protein
VGVRHFSDLAAWQLADAASRELVAISDRAAAANDFGFSDQLRRSALSASANIAEGFGRYQHGDFARFCDFAIGSLAESESHLQVARRAGYMSETDFDAVRSLIRRARAATIRLRNYLRHTKTPDALRK